MKFPRLPLILSFAVLLSTPGYVCAEWEHFNGPAGYQAYDIEAHYQFLLVGTDHGVFRSEDDGNSWTAVNSGLPMDRTFHELVAIDGRLFALTEGDDGTRILRSADDGQEWVAANAGLPDEVQSLVTIGDRLFAIGYDWGDGKDGVYRSLDYGDSWQPTESQELDVEDPDFLYVLGRSLFIVNYDGLYRSTDYGDSWALVSTNLDVDEDWIDVKGGIAESVEVTSVVGAGGSLFASAWVYEDDKSRPLGGASMDSSKTFEALFRSTDDGENWSLLTWEKESEREGATGLQEAISVGETIFACNWNGVYRSTSNGDHWRTVNNGLPAEKEEQSLPLVTSLEAVEGKLFAGTWKGVYASLDNGDTWEAHNSGLPINTHVQSLISIESTLFASLGAHGVYRSRDGGNSWIRADRASNVIGVRTIRSLGTDLFVSTRQGIYRSRNNGENWQPIKPIGLSQFGSIVLMDKDLYRTSYLGIYRSNDDGRTWSKVNTPVKGGITQLLVSNSTIFFAGMELGLFRSVDRGESWIDIDDLRLYYYPYLTKMAGILFTSDSSGIFMSTDDGDSWTPVNSGLPEPPFRDSSPWRTEKYGRIFNAAPPLAAVEEKLFVSTEIGVFVYDEKENTWKAINRGFPTNTLVTIDGSQSDLFGFTRDNGTWRLRISRLQGAYD